MVLRPPLHRERRTVFRNGSGPRRRPVGRRVHCGAGMATNAGGTPVRPVGCVDRDAKPRPWIDRSHHRFPRPVDGCSRRYTPAFPLRIDPNQPRRVVPAGRLYRGEMPRTNAGKHPPNGRQIPVTRPFDRRDYLPIQIDVHQTNTKKCPPRFRMAKTILRSNRA